MFSNLQRHVPTGSSFYEHGWAQLWVFVQEVQLNFYSSRWHRLLLEDNTYDMLFLNLFFFGELKKPLHDKPHQTAHPHPCSLSLQDSNHL